MVNTTTLRGEHSPTQNIRIIDQHTALKKKTPIPDATEFKEFHRQKSRALSAIVELKMRTAKLSHHFSKGKY